MTVGRGDRFDLRRLATLSEVARLKSFSAAADALNFTQSAVSQQVALLERQAGVPLLNRSPVSLTRAGEVLCARAEAALAEMRAAEIQLEHLQSLREGRIALGAFASACAALMPTVIATFRAQHPNVEVSLLQGEVIDTEELLKSGGLDLAVTFEYSVSPLTPDPLIERTVLLTEPVYVAMRADNPLARSDGLCVENLWNEPWIQAADAGLPLSQLSELADSPPLAPRMEFAGDDLATVRNLVASGLGVALLPGLAFEQRPDIVFRRLVDLNLTRTVLVSVLMGTQEVGSVTVMRDLLTASAWQFGRRLRAAD